MGTGIDVTRNAKIEQPEHKRWILDEIGKTCGLSLDEPWLLAKGSHRSIAHFLRAVKRSLLLRKNTLFFSENTEKWAKAVQEIERRVECGEENNRIYDKKHRNCANTFWPNHQINPAEKLANLRPFARSFPFITKKTKIATAGSCFAIEIAKHLQNRGFHYLITEHWGEPGQPSHSSARWGIIFNTPSFRQLVQKSFGEIKLPQIYWTQNVEGLPKVYDPFREDIIYDNVRDYEIDQDIHLANSRKAFQECELFIFTLGMNEVWRLAGSQFVFSRSPWQTAGELIERRFLTVEENVQELRQAIRTVRRHNPHCRFIFSVSPVPLHATFDANRHVVESNTLSKAILRVAAEQVCDPGEGIYYFPSYEYVMACAENPWEPDERHVNPRTVAAIMDMFEEMFVQV